MKHFIYTIKDSNRPLYYLGLGSLVMAFICFILTLATSTEVLGINAWIKPLKFYLSTCIFVWSMAYYMSYLNRPKAVTIYSWLVFAVFVFELPYITIQAAIGELSHFNISSAFHSTMFNGMGILITILTLWTVYICYLFFTKSHNLKERHVLWGIRFGIFLFVIFALVGGIMGANLSHTVGAPDGGPGLPVTNWSTEHGDLRIAHFLGMHALQIIPAAAYFIFRKSYQVILFSLAYLIGVSAVLYQALQGIPLFSFN